MPTAGPPAGPDRPRGARPGVDPGASRTAIAPSSRFVGYLHLVEACRAPGCPVCRCLHDLGRRHLAALVSEHVTDPETRGRLAESWGVCAAHAVVLRDVPDAALGVAVVYQELLARACGWLREAEREALAGEVAGARWRRRLALRRVAPPDGPRRRRARCPACALLVRGERDYLATLVAAVDDPELGAAYGASDGLCLPHVERALAGAAGRRGAARLVARTRDRVERLAAELGGFIDKHDHRTRAAFTEDEARSWTRALETIAGRAERFGSEMA